MQKYMTQAELELLAKLMGEMAANPNTPLLTKILKIGLSSQDRADIIKKILETLGSNVYSESEILALTENKGILVAKDTGSWYYWEIKLERPNKYEFGGTLEDSAAIDELRANKTDVKMLNWGFGPEEVTTKKDFYTKVGQVFVNKPTQSIYMYGEPEQLNAHFFDIWGKPEGFKATYAFVTIRPLSNEHSRVSFKMYINSSNYGTTFEMAVSGYAGTYVGDTGWRNLKQSKESVTAEPNTVAVRQSDGGLLANTNLSNPDDMELTNAKYVRQKIEEAKTDAFDLSNMIINPYKGLIIDLSEDGKQLEIHLDRDYPFTELLVKRYAPDKHTVTLDDAEIQLLKGLRVDVEFQYDGIFMTQTHLIWFPTVPTQAVVHLGSVLPNPQIFSDLITAQYNDNTSEVTVQTTGSGIPTIIRIIDVKGIV